MKVFMTTAKILTEKRNDVAVEKIARDVSGDDRLVRLKRSRGARAHLRRAH